MSKFGERVREGRDLKAKRDGSAFTQADLAEAVAKSRNTIDGWENRGVVPPPHTRSRVAQALDVSLDWLEGATDDPAPPAPNGKGGNYAYISSSPIARAMGVRETAPELGFTSITFAQRGRIWLEEFLLELAQEGATEDFVESARRLLLNPSNYEHGFGAAAGHRDAMDDEQKLRHMRALSVGVRAALEDRKKKGGTKK